MKVVLLFAVLAGTLAIPAGSSAAAPEPWFWSKERAASVGYVSDQPTGCTRAIYKSGWIGKCVSPNYTYGGAECEGVGSRIVHATDDVYLYRTFKCGFATLSWTSAQLNAAYQHMAEIVCKEQQNDATAYNTCLAAALKDRVGTARSSGGMGGAGLWLRDAATKATSTLRVQVTGRFTARVTWLGTSWKKTIQPSG